MDGATAIQLLEEKHSVKVADTLARDSVFAALSSKRRQALADSGTILRLEKGQRLFGHGDKSDAAYAIFAGEIEIAIPGLDGRAVWLARIKGGDHRHHVSAFRHIRVGTSIRFRKTVSGSLPLHVQSVPNGKRVLRLEGNAADSTLVKWFEGIPEQITDLLSSLDDLAAGEEELRIIGVLRHRPIPVAVFQGIQVFLHYSLCARLFF